MKLKNWRGIQSIFGRGAAPALVFFAFFLAGSARANEVTCAEAGPIPAQATTLSASAALPATPATSESRAVRVQYPVVDPAHALSGEALMASLQAGGLVLYVRHTETGTMTEECSISNLSPNGEKMARELGKAMRMLRIPISKVYSSPVCRVRDTARLMDLGSIVLADELGNVAKVPTMDLAAMRMRLLAEMPVRGTNTLAVSHMHAGVPLEHWMELAFGETIVFRPDGRTSIPVARVPFDTWKTGMKDRIALP